MVNVYRSLARSASVLGDKVLDTALEFHPDIMAITVARGAHPIERAVCMAQSGFYFGVTHATVSLANKLEGYSTRWTGSNPQC